MRLKTKKGKLKDSITESRLDQSNSDITAKLSQGFTMPVALARGHMDPLAESSEQSCKLSIGKIDINLILTQCLNSNMKREWTIRYNSK